MYRRYSPSSPRLLAFALSSAALLSCASPGPAPRGPGSGGASAAPTQIWLSGPRFFPEGIAIAPDGTTYVGSMGSGQIVKILRGQTKALPFAHRPGRAVTGMLVDSSRLWACDMDLSGSTPGTLTGYRRADGQIIATHDIGANKGSFCNDLAMDGAGHIYITDTVNHRVFKVAAADALTQNSAQIWSEDPVFTAHIKPNEFSLNGIAFNGSDALYTVNFTSGELLRVGINPDGSAAAASVITMAPRWDVTGDGKPDIGLKGPDGIKFLDEDTLLVVENSGGGLTAVDLDGKGGAKAWPINNRLHTPATVAVHAGTAWVTESQVDHLFGIDRSPASVPFRIIAVPLGDLAPNQD